MGTEFKWQKEDEQWDETTSPTTAVPSGFRRLWPWLLSLLLLLIVAGAGYRQLQQQLAETQVRIEGEVLSSHHVIRQAAVTQDEELLHTFLSGREPGWTEAQKKRLANGLFDYPFLGLTSTSGATATEVAVTVSNDLSSAELVTTAFYTTTTAADETMTVPFTQTLVYRRGPDRWLWAPPDDEFWGGQNRVSTRHLRLNYPGRDKEIVRRLSGDLDQWVNQICTELVALDCPADLQLQLDFGASAETMVDLNDWRARVNQGFQIRLPAPTLVGIPQDESAYEALFRGYADLVAVPLIAELTGYECCEQAFFFQALYDQQMARLGLRPWPLQAVDYELLLSNYRRVHYPATLWRRSYDERAEAEMRTAVYAVVDFILSQEPALAAADLQRALQTAGSFTRWLNSFADPADRDNRWIPFLVKNMVSAAEPHPVPLPDESIRLICVPGDGQTMTTLLYNPREGDWSSRPEQEMSSNHYQAWPLGEETMLIEEVQVIEELPYWHISLWREGTKTVLVQESLKEGSSLSIFDIDPAARKVILVSFSESQERWRFSLLDLNRCPEPDCGLTPLPGPVSWSPDGSRTLITNIEMLVQGRGTSDDRPTLFLGDSAANLELELGLGYGHGWLDNEHFIYLTDERTDPQLVVSHVDQTIAATLTVDALRPLLPPGHDRSTHYGFGEAKVNPARPEQLLVFFYSNGNLGNAWLKLRLLYNWRTGEIDLISPVQEGSTYAFFSPDGRWLSLYEGNLQSGRPGGFTLALIDLTTGEEKVISDGIRFFPGARPEPRLWSADSQWLLYRDNLLLYLVAPDYDYRQLVPIPSQFCQSAEWVPE